MDSASSDAAAATTPADAASPAKRKRSPSLSAPSAAPAPKSVKTAGSSQLSINYLARQSPEDLPLINKEDNLPNLLHLLSAYSNILDRHESLASNLGARPLGPILIKRFERCFDAPPKIVASHHRNASLSADDPSHQITWLEVIEFARSHPGQFTLTTFSEGKRVCQFYYPQKQLRVQISEEDFLFINSGRCQELIPPLPIYEDEEQEMGTCDVLEAKLKELTNAADMVAARTRQLSHRLKGRRAAILERRAEGGSGTSAKVNSVQTSTAPMPSSGSASASGSGPSSGFVAVNAGMDRTTDGGSIVPTLGSSGSIRNELLRHFESLPHNQGQGRSQQRNQSVAGLADGQQFSSGVMEMNTVQGEIATSTASSLSPVPTNAFGSEALPYASTETVAASRVQAGSTGPSYTHRPSSSMGGNPYGSTPTPLKHNFSRPLPPALESSQPFRPLCQAHMDSLPRGHRVLPPCDRCRRLRMDCVKNLTSCAGCTRKHARCHWRDVSREELGALDHLMDSAYPACGESGYSPMHSVNMNGYANGGSENGDHRNEDSEDDDSNPLEDLEALGEKEEQEREDEEGLRNAKELARQGWEDSLRAPPPDVSGNGKESEHSNGVGRPAAPEQSDSSITDLAPKSALGTTEQNGVHNADALVNLVRVRSESLTAGNSNGDSFRGFKAVNGP